MDVMFLVRTTEKCQRSTLTVTRSAFGPNGDHDLLASQGITPTFTRKILWLVSRDSLIVQLADKKS